MAADLLNHRHLMRDDDDRDPVFFVNFLKQGENGFGRSRIQGACGLVAQKDFGVIGKSSCNGNPLFRPESWAG